MRLKTWFITVRANALPENLGLIQDTYMTAYYNL